MSEPTPVCVVTGSSAGIGRETARGMAERGYSVVVIGRDRARTEAAATYVSEHAKSGAATAMLCDFSSLSEVRRLADEIQRRCARVDVLINNAGLWHPQRTLSRDGIEDTLAVNHLAPFLLTNLLLPTLRKAERARIVNVSSRLAEKLTAFNFEDPQHERKYHGLSVYAQTKLANMLFSAELADRLRGTGIVSNALHPGDVVSDILREKPILRFFGRIAAPLFDTPQSASLTSIHVATAQTLSGTSGGYFKKQKAAKPSPLTADAAARRRLWKLSAELTGLPTDS